MTAGVDVRILGAGPVGCALALALRDARHALELVDPQAAPARGFRPIALSHASRLILERLGAWGEFAAAPIQTVHVSQAGAFGRARLEAADAGVPALGYVTQYADLVAALRARVTVRPEASGTARCTVHAEGASTEARERRYGHDALVARVASRPPAQATAYERFTAAGPLALLPLGAEWAVIWSLEPARAAALADAPAAEFLAQLQACFGDRAGRFVAVHERQRAPLVMHRRALRVAGRDVYIGNAAQSLHPVAGQGLNLGLRDAWDLAQTLRGAEDAGDERALAHFSALRHLDAVATIGVTELLARGFLGTHPLARLARGAVLTSLDILPAARRFFARRMIYGPSALP